MGMSTSVKGVRDLEGVFKKMMEIKLKCDALDISYPKEAVEYFGDCVEESEKYIITEMEEVDIEKAVVEWSSDSSGGFDICIKKIPKGIKKIRFINSW